MPDYIAKSATWLSHECREVKEGERFTTVFPKGPDGKPMRLGENLELVKGAAKEPNAEEPATD